MISRVWMIHVHKKWIYIFYLVYFVFLHGIGQKQMRSGEARAQMPLSLNWLEKINWLSDAPSLLTYCYYTHAKLTSLSRSTKAWSGNTVFDAFCGSCKIKENQKKPKKVSPSPDSGEARKNLLTSLGHISRVRFDSRAGRRGSETFPTAELHARPGVPRCSTSCAPRSGYRSGGRRKLSSLYPRCELVGPVASHIKSRARLTHR